MFGWFKKDQAPTKGPDFRSINSQAKAMELAKSAQLKKLLLLPPEFGGEDIPPNWVLVPDWVVEKKSDTDNNIVLPMAAAGKVTRYQASPQYQGKSFIPNAITIVASDPGSFTMTIRIWGDALENESE